jgi:hypothetical protein
MSQLRRDERLLVRRANDVSNVMRRIRGDGVERRGICGA